MLAGRVPGGDVDGDAEAGRDMPDGVSRVVLDDPATVAAVRALPGEDLAGGERAGPLG